MNQEKDHRENRHFVDDFVDVKLANSDVLANPCLKIIYIFPEKVQHILDILKEYLDFCRDVSEVTLLYGIM